MIVARSVARTACHVSVKRKLLAPRLLELVEADGVVLGSVHEDDLLGGPAARTAGRKCRSVTTTRLPALANWCATCSGVEVL